MIATTPMPPHYRKLRRLVFRDSVCRVDRELRRRGCRIPVSLASIRELWQVATSTVALQQSIDRLNFLDRTERPSL